MLSYTKPQPSGTQELKMADAAPVCQSLPFGGYQFNFVESPPAHYECPVCLLVLREPHILSCCGKKICLSCVEPIRSANKPCPLCQQEFHTMLEKELQRAVLGLKVYCSHKKQGCEWIGQLREFDRHISAEPDGKCLFVEVECVHGCGQRFNRGSKEKHERDLCSCRPLDVQIQRLREEMTAMCESMKFFASKVEALQETIREQQCEINSLKTEVAVLRSATRPHFQPLSQLQDPMQVQHQAGFAPLQNEATPQVASKPTPSQNAQSVPSLNSDVLLLMPKLPHVSTPGVKYFPQEGLVLISGNSKGEQKAHIDTFQSAYQKTLHAVKADAIKVPADYPKEEIKSLVAEFNQQYNQCHFSLNEQSNTVRIVSVSSRQFDQAKKFLHDKLCQPVVRATEILTLPGGQTLTVKRGNLVQEEVTIIVNAADSQLNHSGGVAGALNAASHGQLQRHSDKHIAHSGHVPVGSVAQTQAGGELKCKYVLHAVGPNAFQPGMDDHLCGQLIFQAVTKALNMAQKLKAVSIAFPALSTGIFSVSRSTSATAMMNAIEKFQIPNKSTLNDIRIVIIDAPTHTCFAQELVSRRGRRDQATPTSAVVVAGITQGPLAPTTSVVSSGTAGRAEAATAGENSTVVVTQFKSSTPSANVQPTFTSEQVGAMPITRQPHGTTGMQYPLPTYPLPTYPQHPTPTYAQQSGQYQEPISSWQYSSSKPTYSGHPTPTYAQQSGQHNTSTPTYTGHPTPTYAQQPGQHDSFTPTYPGHPTLTYAQQSGQHDSSTPTYPQLPGQYSSSTPPGLAVNWQKGIPSHTHFAPSNTEHKGKQLAASFNGAGSGGGAFGHSTATPPTGRDDCAPRATSKADSCSICLEEYVVNPVTTNCCQKVFCKGCLDKALAHSPFCPTCKIPLRKVMGNQPDGGTMTHNISSMSLPGYEGCGTIAISYYIPSGIQGPNHPYPGKRFTGTSRTAYLPNNQEGQEVLALLKKAFDQRLVFTVGTSVTSGASNTVVWNDIHHKTNMYGGTSHYGYPDPTYLTRVKEELKAKGIV